jgi:hypothetical protein
MCKSGYKEITNIDISDVVIEKMRAQYQETHPGLKCTRPLYKNVGLTMDATHMTFPSNSFDLVIDKGTYDALLVYHDVIKTNSVMLTIHQSITWLMKWSECQSYRAAQS